ncbi:MAG: hypothetical protein HKN14_15625 [Marinicaulis sp.]|nr:hypothetical protein [Marinicaulis sp.]
MKEASEYYCDDEIALFAGVALLLLSAFLIFFPISQLISNEQDIKTMFIVVLIAPALVTLGILLVRRAYFDDGVIVRIDQTGVYYRWISTDLIHWDSIEKIRVAKLPDKFPFEIKNIHFSVKKINIDEWSLTRVGILQQSINSLLGPSEFGLNALYLKRSLDELVATNVRYFDKNGVEQERLGVTRSI